MLQGAVPSLPWDHPEEAGVAVNQALFETSFRNSGRFANGTLRNVKYPTVFRWDINFGVAYFPGSHSSGFMFASWSSRDLQVFCNRLWSLQPFRDSTTNTGYYVFWHGCCFDVNFLVVCIDLCVVNSTLCRLLGVSCCQMIWFFRRESGRNSKGMVAFVRPIVHISKDDGLFRCHAGPLRLACKLFPFVIFD